MIESDKTAEDYFGIDEEGEIKWMAVLASFDTDVFPIFQRQGYTRAEAFMIWQMNAIKNAIYCLQDTLLEDEDG